MIPEVPLWYQQFPRNGFKIFVGHACDIVPHQFCGRCRRDICRGGDMLRPDEILVDKRVRVLLFDVGEEPFKLKGKEFVDRIICACRTAFS